ncbi:MAG: HEAT repeat domain-containing protein [Coprothermobacterota bacterium]|nr:HEAT repeat domain-containing protein [Coprothermobacterota bacterium]
MRTRRLDLKERLEALEAMKSRSLSEEVRLEIRAALGDKDNLVAAKAASLAKHFRLADLLPELQAAYRQFLINPQKTDKLCLAKEAAIEALDALEDFEEELFLHAAGYVQLEHAYGGPTDTAGSLRVAGCRALARIGSRELFFVLSDRLADSEANVRSAAAQILSSLGDERSELLLRMKASVGDSQPAVIGYCFRSLMALHSQRSFPFVTRYLDAPEARIAEEAIFALGESRHPQAFPLLSEVFSHTADPERRGAVISAISLLRSEEALQFLLRAVAEEPLQQARIAVDALPLYCLSETEMARFLATAESRGSQPLIDRCTKVIDRVKDSAVNRGRP